VLEAKREPLFEIFKKHYDFKDAETTLITFEKLNMFLEQFVNEDMTFGFLPLDLHFCLYENDQVIRTIKRYLVINICIFNI
jgi:hypothetical protein